MEKPDTNRTGPHVAAQVAASWAAFEVDARSADLAGALQGQDQAFLSARQEMQAVRDFVGSPSHILGSDATKHGEIAEQLHVGLWRAVDVLHGRAPTATFDGVQRLASVDYRVDGVDIQSKYYAGLRNTLDGVYDHTSKYPDFASGDGRYHIPKDQYQQLEQLHQTGGIEGLSDKHAGQINNRLETLQQETSRSADELIHPGEGTYSEVQKGRITDAIRDREGGLTQENSELKQELQTKYGPSWAGLGQAAAVGAAAGGGVRLGQALWVKYREGKNPFKGQFEAQDWKDVGVVTAQGAGVGAVAGGTLYVLTNSTALSAPFAGAFVSSLIGVGSLLKSYHAGEINGIEFMDMSQIVATDAVIVGIAAAAGQAIIPVPLLGAFMGSLAGKFVASAIKGGLGDAERELMARLNAYEKDAFERLDQELQATIQKLNVYFGRLEDLATAAFDPSQNNALRLEASIEFAETVGVPDHFILRSTKDLDAFILE